MLLVSSVYIFNISQQKYLTVTDSGIGLSDAPAAISISEADTGERYTITSANGQSRWVLVPTSADTYAVGLDSGDANASSFVYASAAEPSGLATTYTQPSASFSAAQWMILRQTGDEVTAQEVTLDEAATEYSRPAFGRDKVSVTLKRRLTKGRWNSFCLPFPLTDGQIQQLWGNATDKARVAEFKEFADGSKVTFTYVDNIEAGKPCALYAPETSADNTYTIDGIEATSWQQGNAPTDDEKGGMRYVGQYVSRNAPNGSFIFGSDDKIYRVVSDLVAMKGYRACFVLGDGAEAPARQLLWTIDDTPTGVDSATSETTSLWPADIHATDGTIVRRQASSTAGLPRGVYVAKGKKLVVE